MKYSLAITGALASTILALPQPTVDYSKLDYSHVDWNKVDYSHVDYSKIDWTKIDYSHVDYSKVDWANVDYSKVDWTKVPYEHYPSHPPQKDNKNDDWKKSFPFEFTSTYHVKATPDQVVNASNIATGGLSGALGYYDFAINSKKDLICWYIELENFRGEYQSPARTATHVHQAAKGKNGPPRIAFPNPVEVDGNHALRRSVGCMQGPFRTGLNDTTTGIDTGVGFTVAQIEREPAAFFADVHSSLAVPGAVRGQLA